MGYCIKVVVYLMNMLPSSVTSAKNLYELLYSKQHVLTHFRVIGCICYDSSFLKGDKFSARVVLVVLMGYSKLQKVYILLHSKNNKFFVSRDVIFQDKVFPFDITTSEPQS